MTKKQKIKAREKFWNLFQKENPNAGLAWKYFKKAIQANGGLEKSMKMIKE